MQCGLCGRWTGTLQPGGCNLVSAVEKQPEEDKALRVLPWCVRVCVCVCVCARARVCVCANLPSVAG